MPWTCTKHQSDGMAYSCRTCDEEEWTDINTKLARLQSVVEAAQAFCDEITYEAEVGDGTNVIICGLCGTADGHLDDCAAKVTMDALAALKGD